MGAVTCTEKVLLTPPAVAVRTSVSDAVTEETAALKLALEAPAGMVMIDGTDTAAPLLTMLTLNPPAGAAPVSDTVHASVPDVV